MNPQYLGDAVYIQTDVENSNLILSLTTHILDESAVIIYLEDDTTLAVLKYIKANRPDLLTSL